MFNAEDVEDVNLLLNHCIPTPFKKHTAYFNVKVVIYDYETHNNDYVALINIIIIVTRRDTSLLKSEHSKEH